ncbi:hypothetical protein SRABI13_01661 [Erwinia aphidicola]|jgi:phage-related protein|uniref:phage tail protein n=1 Tax=Erwinia aphidicola TaxID=68334 RepID=UPI000C1998C0|nr:phage tail protein [Erwinia aphidicola]PIJ58723.1 phage tail protein [Erwinia sp. OLMDLW33]CAH0198318.1 hypothetical protein SRABI13_01661 [Erwinia aphidicola]
MATDTFEWPVRISGSEQITVSALMAQFGDGYRQVAENGINSASETWNLSVNGQRDEMAAVRTFLKNHVIRSFWWVNPWGEKKLYRVKTDSINPKFINKGFVEITFTFEQAFAP